MKWISKDFWIQVWIKKMREVIFEFESFLKLWKRFSAVLLEKGSRMGLNKPLSRAGQLTKLNTLDRHRMTGENVRLAGQARTLPSRAPTVEKIWPLEEHRSTGQDVRSTGQAKWGLPSKSSGRPVRISILSPVGRTHRVVTSSATSRPDGAAIRLPVGRTCPVFSFLSKKCFSLLLTS